MQTAAQTEQCTNEDVKKIAKHNLEGIKYTNICTVQLSAPLSCLVYIHKYNYYAAQVYNDPFSAISIPCLRIQYYT